MELNKAALDGRLAQITSELEQKIGEVNKLIGQRAEVQTMLDYLATAPVSQEELDAKVTTFPNADPGNPPAPDAGLRVGAEG